MFFLFPGLNRCVIDDGRNAVVRLAKAGSRLGGMHEATQLGKGSKEEARMAVIPRALGVLPARSVQAA